MNTKTAPVQIEQQENNLLPVFLKLDALNILLVGAGKIGYEKLNTILLQSRPNQITIVAPFISEDVARVAAQHANIITRQKAVDAEDAQGNQIAIIAVNDEGVCNEIVPKLRAAGILMNVADKPALCDFYLGAVVKKGHVKIAISTNGKSPTLAKRIRDHLNTALPDELSDLADNLASYRKNINGDFEAKVKELNKLTGSLANDNAQQWKQRARLMLLVFASMLAGYFIFTYIPFKELATGGVNLYLQLDENFGWVLMAGFLAQLIDGSLGMGYGITSATIMLSAGVNPAVMSGSIHTAEMFASGVSGLSHYRFGNVNKKLFKAIVIPGVIGAVLGALLLYYFGESEGKYLRPVIAAYTLFLGVKFILNAFNNNQPKKRFKRYGLLAGTGGFLDSFAGGGWGPIVTSTLINRGRSPRFVIGTVSLTEFFVTLSSAFAFFILIGVSHWQAIVALIIGSTLAAPLAAKLAGRLPRKTSFILLGVLVIIWSLRLILKAL